MILKLSNVKVGTPKRPTQWSNEAQKNVEYDHRTEFICNVKHSIVNREQSYEEYNETLKKIEFEIDDIGNTEYYHINYLEYLEKCLSDDLGIVISPDIVWFTILSEFASIVKSNVELYRSLFTTSIEKQEIVVISASLMEMPLNTLVTALKNFVPSDTSIYFPAFGFTENSEKAFLSVFCDICSPFYNYSMYLCSFPYIDIKGDIDNWRFLKSHWIKLKSNIKDNSLWVQKVDSIINNIIEGFYNVDFWKKMFLIKKCGSGHQTEVSGWFSDLFVDQPKVRYVENFSSHVSSIQYKQIQTKQIFKMSTGLFGSLKNDKFMIPSFSSVIFNITKALNETNNTQSEKVSEKV